MFATGMRVAVTWMVSPTVPADYEGIAMVQRALVLRNMPKEGEGAAPPPAVDKK